MSLWVPNSGSKRKDKVNDNSSVTLGKLEWVRVERKEPIARVTTLYSGRAGRYPIMWASLYYLLRFDIFEHCWVSGHQIWSCILVLVWLVNWKDPYLIMCSYLPILCVCVCSVVWPFVSLMGCSPPGTSVHGMSQTRILEWFSISSSRGSSWPRKWAHISCISCIGRQESLPLSHLGSPPSYFTYVGTKAQCN